MEETTAVMCPNCPYMMSGPVCTHCGHTPAPDPAGIPPAPWAVTPGGVRIVDATNYPVADTLFGPLPRAVGTAAEIVRCVNAFHPAKDAVQPPQTVLALAILNGDESAAYAAADDVLAHSRQPDGFVGRGELIGLLRQWMAKGPPLFVSRRNIYDTTLDTLARLDAGTPAAPAGES